MEPAARTRLIETTARLLQTQGYHNTGLNQIVSESAAPKGSLYHYFPGGKVDLAVAAIRHSAAATAQQLAALSMAQPSALLGLTAVIDHFIAEFESSAFQKGCPIATVTLEQAALDDAIQAACAGAYALWQQGLEAWLTALKVPNAAFLAEHLLVLIEGAMLLSRAQRDCAPLRRVRSGLPLLLNLSGSAA
ncbi:MAG: TetR/AcrR family transcriptional regulator [Nevskia sp.]|nr:TetR/AcrR family transcriptional regulator [Nevskia sp.]